MLDTWKRRRKLERELSEIYDHYAPELKDAKTEDDYRAAREPFDIDVAEIVAELERLKTRKIREQAIKFGIDFPPFENSEDNWDDIPYSSGRRLTEKAQVKLVHQVSVARFAYWRQWAELLIPILSLLVSLVLAFATLKRST